MRINNTEGGGVSSQTREKVVAFVFTYNRMNNNEYDDALCFLQFTTDHLKHIKRK